MKKIIKHSLKYCVTLSLALFLSCVFCFSSSAESGGASPSIAPYNPKVLRVAFPQVKGSTETDKDGTRHGLVVDYLNEIAKYTGWKYEYIDVESGTEMLKSFQNGEYDLMGGQFYISGLEKYYAYPDYNTGYSRASILARKDDRSIRSNDLETLNGKTIGVYSNANETIRRLKEFLSFNNIDCTLKEYSYDQLKVTGNLYAYLESGEVDLLLGNAVDAKEAFRIVATFDSQPYFIVTTPGNQDILDGLNMALEKISDYNPYFGEERYNANFPEQSISIQLTQEEVNFVEQKKTFTVAVPEQWHPLFCLNSSNDEMHNGLIPDILQEISAFTGLEFSYVYAKTYSDAVELVRNGEADILGFFLGTEEEAANQGLSLTSSYSVVNNIIVRNKAASYPAKGSVCAVLKGQDLPNSIEADEVRKYDNLTDALSAVNKGEIDFVYGLSPRLEQEIQQHYFSNLVSVTFVNENSDICFAMRRPIDPTLFTILNKAINNLSNDKKVSLLNNSIVSIGVRRFSLEELIYSNPVAFVSSITVILLFLVSAVLLIARARMKAAVIQSNLDKAEAQNRAKGEFLSRMSHEIRTPMNAVIGLADLTCMMNEVPENIRENLSKIRSSSQYLLNLINDILDMSRIENEMLSINEEPFSLNQTLDNLKSMMDSEAKRHGLTFSIEKSIFHSSLSGDAIRLHQVLTNLLSNAFKFTPEGGLVSLQVEEASQTETSAEYTFRVIDTGIGIRPEDQQRIFGSFEQLGTSSSQSQGTGLGLSISRNIVRLMGGDLNLKSSPGKGSEFYFTIRLPFSEDQAKLEPLPDGLPLDDIHILLVEDNDLNAEIAIQFLKIQGASVYRTENGKLAVDRFAQSKPGEFQFILMDIQMPVMNGLDATRTIRALPHPDAGNIPIIAMTANSFQKDVDAALEAGMNGFISKPLDVNLLYRTLYHFLEDKSI